MKIAQLVPVCDRRINGLSLVDDVFGAEVVVRDVLGDMHTTAANARLMERALVLLERGDGLDFGRLAGALTLLREQAEPLVQSDYDRAAWRERVAAAGPDEAGEAAALAGALA